MGSHKPRQTHPHQKVFLQKKKKEMQAQNWRLIFRFTNFSVALDPPGRFLPLSNGLGVTSRYFPAGPELNVDPSPAPIHTGLCSNGVYSKAQKYHERRQPDRIRWAHVGPGIINDQSRLTTRTQLGPSLAHCIGNHCGRRTHLIGDACLTHRQWPRTFRILALITRGKTADFHLKMDQHGTTA